MINSRWRHVLVVSALLSGIGSFIATAQAAEWQNLPVLTAKSSLPAGKTIKIFLSPDKRHQVVLRDENNHGDFFYYAYYYFDGQRYFPLESYVASSILPKVIWSNGTVSFQAQHPIGPDQVQILQIEFHPSNAGQKSWFRKKVLRIENVQAAG